MPKQLIFLPRKYRDGVFNEQAHIVYSTMVDEGCQLREIITYAVNHYTAEVDDAADPG